MPEQVEDNQIERSDWIEAPRVLLAGGSATTRRGLTALLERAEPRFQIVAAMELTADLPEKAVEIAPDLVVLDTQLPDIAAVLTSRSIRGRLSSTAVVLLTAQADSRAVAACAISGAGHVVKSLDGAALAPLLVRSLERQRRLDARIGALVLHWYATRPADGASAQARRATESAILEQVLNGSTDGEIAFETGVDSTTVRSEIARLYGTLSEEPAFRLIGRSLMRWLD